MAKHRCAHAPELCFSVTSETEPTKDLTSQAGKSALVSIRTRSVASGGQKPPRTRRIWMSDRSLHPHRANAHRLQGFSLFSPAHQQQPSPGCGQSGGAGAEPRDRPSGAPTAGVAQPPPHRSFRGQRLPRCWPFPPRKVRTLQRGGGHTRFRSVTGRYERPALRPPPVPGAPLPLSPRCHRTPESRSQPVVIAIQEAVQDAGEILRPQFLLFFALPRRPGETTRQRRKG